MWCPNDKKAFECSEWHNVGQINSELPVGQTLINIVKSENLKTILDIGTWNGLGSTKCFLLGLQGNSSTQFISIESNKDKHESALKNLYPLITDNTHILHGTILNKNDITDTELYSIFPEFMETPEFQRWHSIDMANITISPYILDKIPSIIDLVLFDGGEFTTFFEFKILFPRCKKFIALDDVDVSKCRKIRELLLEHSEWKEVSYIPERNGFSLFKYNT